jgi:hypothetical protein
MSMHDTVPQSPNSSQAVTPRVQARLLCRNVGMLCHVCACVYVCVYVGCQVVTPRVQARLLCRNVGMLCPTYVSTYPCMYVCSVQIL